ncbi:MAG: DUF5686 and carboxypeptidase regulatory-like domain-containing protein [Marinilabiliaceae bacterium]|nr:DUF5686 and carboxypeptidase regulatory-like domain-containing protein [Marinilabiliaceae bacterium]
MKLHIFISILFIFISVNSFSRGIRGKVVDDAEIPIPNVSIYFKELLTGTTTNNEGLYEISLPAGVYTLSFQSVGFTKQEFRITIKDKWLELDVTMLPFLLKLSEVKVYSGEDPAYPIMRKAISRAPYFLNQVKNYEAEIYLKGSYTIQKMPKIFEKVMENDEDNIKIGQTYTSESLNRLRFAAPDTIDHKVIASQNSYPGDDIESNIMPFTYLSLYDTSDNELFISPLAANAFRHYNFRYEGFIDEGKYTVNIIKVIPKRKSQQLFAGEIYIVENLWCIYSADLSLEMFMGKVKISQLFGEVRDKVWLPVNHFFTVDFGMLGVKGDMNFTGAVKFLSVNTNDKQKVNVFKESELASVGTDEDVIKEDKKPSLTKNQQKIEELLEKDDLKNRDMMKLAGLMEKENTPSRKETPLEIKDNRTFEILKDSITRDTHFWDNMRPIPLTQSEKEGFEIEEQKKLAEKPKDEKKKKRGKVTVSIGEQVSVDTEITEDSTSIDIHKKTTFGTVSRDILLGRSFPRGSANFRVWFGGLITLRELDFNPVDGFKYGQNIALTWTQASGHYFNMGLSGGYGFSRKAFHGNFSLTQEYAKTRRGSISFFANFGSKDYNPEVDINRLIFAGSSLFFKYNFPRFYENKSLSVKNQIDIANGLQLDFTGSYLKAAPLENNTNFSLAYQNKDYKPNEITNNPAAYRDIANANNDVNNLSVFKEQETFWYKAKFSYTPYQRYYFSKGRKVMTESDFPTFTLGVEQGLKLFSSDADYLLAEIGAYNNKKLFSFRPQFIWDINAGWFLIDKQLHFSRFFHFNATKIPIKTNGFFFIDSYEASTNQWFVRGNGTYSTPYLLIKYLPFLSNKIWNENIHVGYIHTPDFQNYVQVGYSLTRIFILGNIGVFAGFSDWEYKHWGVRVSLSTF